MTVKAMKSGAVEFFTKPFNHGELVAAIAQALYRSKAILAFERELSILRKRHASLTQRERQVMSLVVAGLLNKQVATELGITETTVKAHRGRVMRKMQASSVPDLVHMVSALGTERENVPGADPALVMTP
jgi:FixJ family two-component response regulator